MSSHISSVCREAIGTSVPDRADITPACDLTSQHSSGKPEINPPCRGPGYIIWWQKVSISSSQVSKLDI